MESLSQNLIKDWRILTSGNRKIEGMSSFGTYHSYGDRENLQIALKKLFIDYNKIVNGIENYKTLSKLDFKDGISLTEICHLYLMKDLANGYYKIGISNNPEYREKTLQSEKPTIKLITSKDFSNRKIALVFESSLHKSYENKRLRGEWFELNEREISEIKETELNSTILSHLEMSNDLVDAVKTDWNAKGIFKRIEKEEDKQIVVDSYCTRPYVQDVILRYCQKGINNSNETPVRMIPT